MHLIVDFRMVILNHGIDCSGVVEMEGDVRDYHIDFVKVAPLVEHFLAEAAILGKDFIVFVSELGTVVKPSGVWRWLEGHGVDLVGGSKGQIYLLAKQLKVGWILSVLLHRKQTHEKHVCLEILRVNWSLFLSDLQKRKGIWRNDKLVNNLYPVICVQSSP